MSDLTDFMLSRIAEDEEVAQALADAHPSEDWDSYISSAGFYDGPAHTFAGQFDHVRVLAECEAKRRIVELAAPWAAYTGENNGMARLVQDMNLRLLALPYASHPDYRQEWAP